MVLLERGANPDQKDSQGRYGILQNINVSIYIIWYVYIGLLKILLPRL